MAMSARTRHLVTMHLRRAFGRRGHRSVLKVTAVTDCAARTARKASRRAMAVVLGEVVDDDHVRQRQPGPHLGDLGREPQPGEHLEAVHEPPDELVGEQPGAGGGRQPVPGADRARTGRPARRAAPAGPGVPGPVRFRSTGPCGSRPKGFSGGRERLWRRPPARAAVAASRRRRAGPAAAGVMSRVAGQPAQVEEHVGVQHRLGCGRLDPVPGLGHPVGQGHRPSIGHVAAVAGPHPELGQPVDHLGGQVRGVAAARPRGRCPR